MRYRSRVTRQQRRAIHPPAKQGDYGLPPIPEDHLIPVVGTYNLRCEGGWEAGPPPELAVSNWPTREPVLCAPVTTLYQSPLINPEMGWCVDA